jgi:hypothetical protein
METNVTGADLIRLDIDMTIKKCMAHGLTNLAVHLPLKMYLELLTLKGIVWEPASRAIGATFDDRPVKLYRRRWPLEIIGGDQGAAQVLHKNRDGSLTGYAIYRPS